jgi:nucleotide-binding universal stress UspA family protein
MKAVVGVDGSEHGLAALKFCIQLLDPKSDSVVLHYSVPTAALEAIRPQSADDFARARDAFTQAVFQQALDSLPAEVRQRCVTVHDRQKPHKGLLATAAAQSADLLAVGARGTGPIKRLLLGSVSQAVAHAGELPTLIVRNPPPGAPDRPFRLLIACSDDEAGRLISQVLHKLSWPTGTSARIVHVMESLFAGEIPDWLVREARSQEVEVQAKAWVLEHENDKKLAQERMREYCESLPKGIERTDVTIVEGNPAQQILALLDKEEFDLTVLGSHGLGRVMRVLLGSTSEHVLAHAPNSVLIVPV